MFPQELAQKIRGYQDEIASLNSKCKMLTMKAKHATMLLTVTEVEGLAPGAEDLAGELLPAPSAHPSVVMVSGGSGVRGGPADQAPPPPRALWALRPGCMRAA